MSEAVSEWLEVAESKDTYKANINKAMRRYPSEIVGISMPGLFAYA
jgi:hypothetical protein